ncbi:MAG: STAS domain-containing protein [Steroidobacteraceae bacterium]|jgi:anti-anti-sigma regulatory factor
MSVTKMPAPKKRKPSPRAQPKAAPPEPAAVGASVSRKPGPEAAVGAAVCPEPSPEVPVGASICLEPSLEIKDVEAAHLMLATALTRAPRLTVDVSRVAAIDTAGVQLLLAFQSDAEKRGVVTEYRGESAALAHALAVLGLRDRLRIAVPRD